MYEFLIMNLRNCAEANNLSWYKRELMKQAADAIEELSNRIDRAVELYNCGVEKSAMYEALKGISPKPPKDEASAGPYDLLYEEGGANTT